MMRSTPRARGLVLLALVMLVPLTVADLPEPEQRPDVVPGPILGVVEVPLTSEDVAGDQRVRQHLLEVWTAVWCLPCQELETTMGPWTKAGQLDDLAIVAWHPWGDDEDDLAAPAAEARKDVQGVFGYPTLIADGDWSLLGEPGGQWLPQWLENRSSVEPELDLRPRLKSVSHDSSGATVQLDVVGDDALPDDLVVEAWIIEDAVMTASEQRYADEHDDVVRGHISAALVGRDESLRVPLGNLLSEPNNATLVLVLRHGEAAAPEVWAGPRAEDRPWVAPEPGRAALGTQLVVIALAGLLVVSLVSLAHRRAAFQRRREGREPPP